MELETNGYEYNDVNAILEIRDNNGEAKDYLFTKYSPLIHKEITDVKKKAAKLGADFQDLTQEAMLGFSFAINNFDEDSEAKFITFATLCIRRRLSNYLAKFETGKNKALVESLPLDATLNDRGLIVDSLKITESADPLRKLINSETLRELQNDMGERLSKKEMEALRYDIAGKSISEIAELMNISNKQVYNLIFRARSKIK